MKTVSIRPEAMSIDQATRLYESLDSTGRQEFYQSLSDTEKDALYRAVTDHLIHSVPLTEKNRVDAQMNTERNKRRGSVIPDECHAAENDCLWRSAAWYVSMGQVSASLVCNLSHMRGHFDALQMRTQDAAVRPSRA